MWRRQNRYVLARERNVIRVDFGCEPDPWPPTFPGAGALHGADAKDHTDEAWPTRGLPSGEPALIVA